MGLHTHPLFPWQYKPHGHIGLWHLLPEYDDIVNAWDYSKGDGITVINCETLYWGIHPDLIDQWNTSYYTSPPNGIPRPPQTTGEYDNEYHATNIAGILVGKDETTMESTLSANSSVGIAPHAKLIGGHFDNIAMDNFITSHPLENIRVVSISHLIGDNLTTLNWLNRFTQELNVVVVGGRGYYTSDHGDMYTGITPIAQDIDGVISVGDYKPDYQVYSQYSSSVYNADPNYYQVEINAPGWCVWTTSFTVNQDHTQIFPMIKASVATSTATPQVAGVCVLLASLYPWMTAAQIERQIKLGAHHLNDMITANQAILPTTPPDFYGAGCLDAYGSLFLHGNFIRNFTFQNEPNNTALLGTEFQLNNSTMTVVNGILRVQKNANVQFNNSTLVLGNNVRVIMEAGSRITLDATSSLTVGNHVTFETENGESCDGIFLEGNNGIPVSFNNTLFTNCSLNTHNTDVDLDHCTFDHSSIYHHNKGLEVENSTFNFGYINAIQTIYRTADHVYITNCHIENANQPGVSVTNFEVVKIVDNQIEHCQGGVELFHCMGGYIETNEISYNTNGIYLFNTYTDIIGTNHITCNSNTPYREFGNGITAERNSQWSMVGDTISTVNQTIHNDEKEQLLFESNSIPYPIYYNEIYSINHDFPYVRVWGDSIIEAIDIADNYWSNNFNPDRDFYPRDDFKEEPIWIPGRDRQAIEDEAEALYDQATNAEVNEDYIVAEALLKEIIAEYADTDICPIAAKELLYLYETYNQNYEALEMYYKTYPTLRDDPRICEMADYLATLCDIKQGDFEDAISFFEDIILHPDNLPDSIFAVIDAGYTYLLLAENSEKSAFTGKLAWLKPHSVQEYMDRRQRLIAMLHGSKNETPSEITPSVPATLCLSLNYPNPFNPSTTIEFGIPKAEKVSLKIFNIKGQLVKELVNQSYQPGKYKVVWEGKNSVGKNAASGVYFYRLDAGGKSITHKMLLLK
ncbi:MAG TPA: S8 family serine peptidase [Candidatus Cloacimonadota bacterium]|nr:S8 family serine peptidase [Candidatus Cloacimonadota bacterium]